MNHSWQRIRFLAVLIAGALLLFISFSANSPTAKRMQNVFFVLVGGLIFIQLFLFLKSLLSDRKAKLLREGEQGQLVQSLDGLLLKRRVRESSVAYLFLFMSLFLSSYLRAVGVILVRIEVFLFISALIIADVVRQKILEYRIKKGLFGTNEYEAREIISFILSNTNWSESTSGQGGKRIFSESAEELIHSREALNDAKG